MILHPQRACIMMQGGFLAVSPCPGDLVCSGHLLEDKAGQAPYTQHAVYIGVNQPYLGGSDSLF